MDKNPVKNKEHIHYIIAWFFGVLLFFFLGGWFLSKKIYILNISTSVWGIFLFLYISVNSAYHCYQQIFPYVGERRSLVFVDFFFLALCIFFQFPVFVVLTLLNIQIILVILSIRQETPLPKKFFSTYLILLIILCMFISESSTHKFVAFIVLFCGESIFILSLWYGLEILLKDHNRLWQLKVVKLQQYRIVENLNFSKEKREKEKKQNNNYKRINKNLQQVIQFQQIFLSILQRPLQSKIYQKISESNSQSLDSIISGDRNKDLLKHKKEINIWEFLEETFKDVQNKMGLKNKKTIHFNKDTKPISSTFLYLEPLSTWILYQWSLYLLDNEIKELNISVVDKDDFLSIKGSVRLNIQAIDSDGTSSCPICDKKVRSLYSNHNKKEMCLQCCRKILENELRQDWEENNTSLDIVWLIRKWINIYQLGNIQCGISNWENYEYFITLILNKHEK